MSNRGSGGSAGWVDSSGRGVDSNFRSSGGGAMIRSVDSMRSVDSSMRSVDSSMRSVDSSSVFGTDCRDHDDCSNSVGSSSSKGAVPPICDSGTCQCPQYHLRINGAHCLPGKADTDQQTVNRRSCECYKTVNYLRTFAPN